MTRSGDDDGVGEDGHGLELGLHVDGQVIVLLALAAVAAARPQFGFEQQPLQQQAAPSYVPILKRTETRDDFNQLALSYLSADGTAVAEHVALKEVQDGEYRGHYVPTRSGSYRYTSPEGRIIMVTYTADETGFHPISEAIPVDSA
ncbi:larval cuticle protein 1-like [Thrips palmi]|uniref:Larval cuticle protein 1-like n=1 Tax=Thrips palmi TaxID=161013 RepID=A0A6P8YH53_THRPL|nr:larval cuticle protein 1-like [Thrips palmi]